MTKEELLKKVKQEINWLRYYGYREDRINLDMDKDSIYDQLRSIGYTKVVMPLDLHCVGYGSFKYEEGMTIDDLEFLSERRSTEEGRYTYVEIWSKLYPEDKEWIYNELNSINNEKG